MIARFVKRVCCEAVKVAKDVKSLVAKMEKATLHVTVIHYFTSTSHAVNSAV